MIYVFNYTGKFIEKVLKAGNYLVECWGAQGGKGCFNGNYTRPGGKGAYCSGILTVRKPTTFYIYVGGKGKDGVCDIGVCINQEGGFNGGGKSGCDPQDDDDAGSGGGATDIRLIDDTSNKDKSLRSRIIVASGGSGSALNSFGSPGGDLTGYLPIKSAVEEYKQSSTSQTNGIFGIGADGENSKIVPSSGGGGGYYGGITIGPQIEEANYYKAVSSSGSSFISGYPGCNSVKSEDDGSPSGSPIHYSQFVFIRGLTINGFSSMPEPFSNEYQIGNEGNGVVKITMLPQFHSIVCKNSKFVSLNMLLIIIII